MFLLWLHNSSCYSQRANVLTIDRLYCCTIIVLSLLFSCSDITYLIAYATKMFIYRYNDNFRKIITNIIHQILISGIPAVRHSGGSLGILAPARWHIDKRAAVARATCRSLSVHRYETLRLTDWAATSLRHFTCSPEVCQPAVDMTSRAPSWHITCWRLPTRCVSSSSYSFVQLLMFRV